MVDPRMAQATAVHTKIAMIAAIRLIMVGCAPTLSAALATYPSRLALSSTFHHKAQRTRSHVCRKAAHFKSSRVLRKQWLFDFASLLNCLFPLSFAATQLFEPLLQNCLLIRVDARKHHPHSHIWEQKYYSSQRSECRVCVQDFDPNLRAFWRGIQHVEEASAGT